MPRKVELPYGDTPLTVSFPDHATVVRLEPPGPPRAVHALIRSALESPIGAKPLEDLVRSGDRVLIVVSDPSRDDARGELVEGVLERLPPGALVSYGVATGTHGPCKLERLGLDELFDGASVVNHDAHAAQALVTVGTTRRGTPVQVNRFLVEQDWIIATGTIKPHYFAGYSGGVKAIYPGFGGNESVRINHQLKQHPSAIAGSVTSNLCRLDLEEATAMIPTNAFLLNLVMDSAGGGQAAVAGDVVEAFRAGARICRDLFLVSAPRSDAVVVSDRLPLTSSLYQASKLAAAAASLVRDGGHLIIAAQCPEGTGPIDVVNDGIYEIGIRPRLPRRHRISLVSDLPARVVDATYCEPASSVEQALGGADRPTVLPFAGAALVEVCS